MDVQTDITNGVAERNTAEAAMAYDTTRKSVFSALYSFKEVLPGLLAMFFVAVFSNNLPGVPNPFTLENLFYWLDGVIGPLNHQGFSKIMNSNFVWNPLLLGIVIGNVFGVPDSWKRGLSYIHLLMPLGIIMLAPHFMVFRAFKIGLVPILICVGALFLTSTLTLLVSRLIKLDDRQGAIIAGGLSTGDPHVCAILMPLIKAKGGQVVNSLLCILVFGLIAMNLLPVFGHWLGLPDQYFGLASALGVGNNHQALYAAFEYSYEAGRFASWFDVGRHVIMPAGFIYVFVVVFIRLRRNPDNPRIMAARGIKSFPLWLAVFIFFWILAGLHVFKEPAHQAVFKMVVWDFSLAAGALGLSLSLKDIFIRPGIKGLIVTLISGFIRIALLLLAIWLCVKTGLLPA